jgi:hypothetical protein
MVAQGELDRAALEPAAQLERRATARAGMLDRVGGRLPAGGDDLGQLVLSCLRVAQPAPQKRAHRDERLRLGDEPDVEALRHRDHAQRK